VIFYNINSIDKNWQPRFNDYMSVCFLHKATELSILPNPFYNLLDESNKSNADEKL